jgi:hypothetical protein
LIEATIIGVLLFLLIAAVLVIGLLLYGQLSKLHRDFVRVRTSNSEQIKCLDSISDCTKVLSSHIETLKQSLDSQSRALSAQFDSDGARHAAQGKSIEALSAHGEFLKAMGSGLIKAAKAQTSALIELETTVRSYTQNAFGANGRPPGSDLTIEEETEIRHLMSEGSSRRDAEIQIRMSRADKAHDNYDGFNIEAN